MKTRAEARVRRHRRVRKRILGSAARPRLSVFTSNRHIYAQIVDDFEGRTLAAASSLDADLRSEKLSPGETAARVGKLIAARAKEKEIGSVVFDRGGFLFHGKVKALADAAREEGLRF